MMKLNTALSELERSLVDMEIFKRFQNIILLLLGFTTVNLFQNCGFKVMSAPVGDLVLLSSPLPMDHPTIVTQSLAVEKAPVVQRKYVGELFKEIFTSSQFPVENLESIVDQWIHSKPGQFGYPCNPYDSYSMRDCQNDSTAANLAYQPDPTALSESYRLQACQNILGQNNGVHAALEKIENRKMDQASLVEAYALFYRAVKPSFGVIDALDEMNQSMIQNGENETERWRAVLMQICESPFWQSF